MFSRSLAWILWLLLLRLNVGVADGVGVSGGVRREGCWVLRNADDGSVVGLLRVVQDGNVLSGVLLSPR